MPEGRRQRMRINFRRLYSFVCFGHKYEPSHAQIGQKGYSRVVYCNDPDHLEAVKLNYRGNYVSTTKYTAANFIPKSLFEQFRRVANIYFLVVACVSFSPLAPYSSLSILAPLIVVIGATMAKEGVEDWRRRKQDVEANNREVKVYGSNYTFCETNWKKVRVGDIVKVCKDEYFPADIVLLSCSHEDGVCYVETMNLDGETNLKLKHALDVTSHLHDENSFKQFRAVIKCEDPNEKLYSFIGTLHYDGKEYPLSIQQLLLRGSKLKNTEYVFGVVIFTGHDTKVMQNASDPPSKRSKIEKKMDKIIYLLFGTLVLIAFVGSLFFGVETKKDFSGGRLRRWYLRPDDTTVFYDPKRPSLSAFFHFLTALMLYGYLIPISLYVSIEIVKVLQCIFINQDLDMYDKETDQHARARARARTSNLNEELGQVDSIFSDKTGTLTCNSMEFVKCSIAGTAYGRGMTEVERSLARRRGDPLPETGDDVQGHGGEKSVRGFNFRDERIMNGHWVKEPHPEIIRKFFRVLAICHTAIPEKNEETGEIMYEAESPDEAAFLIAAKEIGFEFFEAKQTSIKLRELDPKTTGRGVRQLHRCGCQFHGSYIMNGQYSQDKRPKYNFWTREYERLQVLEFTTSRKRMSVIVRSEEKKLLLLSKGADSVMFRRLSEDGREFESQTKDHIKKYAEAGLRIMVIAYRELGEDEYKSWEKEFSKAKTSVVAERDELVEAVADKIERNLTLLGATAVEDKLQKGVPECIDMLAQAGIKLWVLTGDKMETAINIGYACSILREDMRQIVITLDSPDIDALEKKGDEDAIAKASIKSIRKQISDGMSQINSAKESDIMFGLIIDGKSLDFSLKKDIGKSFFELAIKCASVICCRSSPKQKALVTRLVKVQTGRTTLAIGDGANDVGMLQEADIGVGISGVEGMQAVMASDFAIPQFRFLERLLLVHGHWCYRRIAMMICYFFYKNIAFGFTLFWFEAHASFSGQPAYNDWYMSFYNVFFTSLPVIALGVFDQDVSAQLCLKYRFLYLEGLENILFSWPRILGWMFNGFLTSLIIFFLTTKSMIKQAFRRDGQVVDYEVLGVTMYTCVVWAVNCQMAISINYFTWIHHFFIWGSIAFWYKFLVIYGYLPPEMSTTAYRAFVEACAPSVLYWLVTLLAVICTLLPYFSFRAFQTRFKPMYHDIIQRKQYEGLEAELPRRVRKKLHLRKTLKQRNS